MNYLLDLCSIAKNEVMSEKRKGPILIQRLCVGAYIVWVKKREMLSFVACGGVTWTAESSGIEGSGRRTDSHFSAVLSGASQFADAYHDSTSLLSLYCTPYKSFVSYYHFIIIIPLKITVQTLGQIEYHIYWYD